MERTFFSHLFGAFYIYDLGSVVDSGYKSKWACVLNESQVVSIFGRLVGSFDAKTRQPYLTLPLCLHLYE